MKKVVFIVFLCLGWWFQIGNAQQTDVLRDAVKNASSDTERFYALMELADYLSYTDTLQALQTLRKALPIVKGKTFFEGVYYFTEAGIYFDYNHQKSQKLYQKAEDYLKWHTTPEAYRYRARLWHNYGTLEQYNGREDRFLNITLDYCIPFAEKSGDSDLLMGYFTDVGMIFANNKEWDKALEYYRKSLSQAENTGRKNEALLWTYLNMLELHLNRKDTEKATSLYRETLNLWKQYPQSKLTALFFRNEAHYFLLVGKNDQALESIEKGTRFAQENNMKWDYDVLHYQKVQALKVLGDYQQAKTELQKLSERGTARAITKNELVFMYELADIESKLGNHEAAYGLMVRHRQLRDSLIAQNDKKMLADMELQYRTAEKEKAILKLENQNKLNRILLLSGIFIVLILSAWLVYAWNARKKRHKKDMLLHKQQQEIEITHALMEGEQQERNRLAQELHDGLGGRITGIKMNVEVLAQNRNEKVNLSDIVRQLDIAIVELRNTAHNLVPPALQKYGLCVAISDFCQSLQTEKQQIKLYTAGLNDLRNPKWQLSTYRIVQELLTNAVKHSEASLILLQCTFKDALLLIEIEDNGKGFDVKGVARNMGLNNIEKRVNYLGGTMEIDSRQGEGTTITIECKIEEL
ncbi:sensor histidine kinase [Capnocytophaga sp.]|uniref:ATP-binding protein n=1 Tax=Capnocytophaga sp. TaxID=44737 RepID=UPI0026DD2F30|nr:sensor histidine kinase [Capnocytophaga sp.]MDO5105588.1 sensor histidine kinase [Capnocytophaga sp.]